MSQDPDDDFLAGAAVNAPPPPPPPPPGVEGRSRFIIDRPAPPSDYIQELGKPPRDAMQAAKWALELNLRMTHEVMMDATLTPSQRRAEIQRCLNSAKGWLIDSMKYDLDKRLDEHKKRLDSKRRGKAMATREGARPPAPAGAKVIPIRASTDAPR